MKNWVLFRFPSQKDIHFIGSNEHIELSSIDISNLKTGFIFRPFNIDDNAIYIHSDKTIINPSNDFLKKLTFNYKNNTLNSTLKDEYINYVSKSIEVIKSTSIQKTVPARVKSISINAIENLFSIFNDACRNYPNAFVNLSSTTKWGVWLGATPEKLISINKDEILETVALAGTQLTNGKALSEAVWTQKEIEEQALVSRFIINCFKEIRLREFEEVGPKTIIAGNLLHLKTVFNIDLKKIKEKKLNSILTNLLHPTSAVCGMPKIDSLQFIKENEKFDRLIYAGFIGPVNYLNETNLFVNLRTAQINKKSINLFAGAGVTEDSNPNKEWEETENKCHIIECLFKETPK